MFLLFDCYWLCVGRLVTENAVQTSCAVATHLTDLTWPWDCVMDLSRWGRVPVITPVSCPKETMPQSKWDLVVISHWYNHHGWLGIESQLSISVSDCLVVRHCVGKQADLGLKLFWPTFLQVQTRWYMDTVSCDCPPPPPTHTPHPLSLPH